MKSILRKKSYNIGKLNHNLFSTHVITNKLTSNVCAKPLENMSSDLRIQRLRLATIGNSSMILKNDNDFIQLNGKNQDSNYVNNVLSRVRGGGYRAPKKGK